jgi:hypothetical protein
MDLSFYDLEPLMHQSCLYDIDRGRLYSRTACLAPTLTSPNHLLQGSEAERMRRIEQELEMLELQVLMGYHVRKTHSSSSHRRRSGSSHGSHSPADRSNSGSAHQTSRRQVQCISWQSHVTPSHWRVVTSAIMTVAHALALKECRIIPMGHVGLP